jgi:hypothetical protein
VAARGEQARLIAHRYNWDLVTDGYEELCHDLARLRVHSARGAYRRPSALPSASAQQSLGAGQ